MISQCPSDSKHIFDESFLKEYIKSYEYISVSNEENKVQNDETLFYRFSFGKRILIKNYIHIGTEYVINKSAYEKFINTMKAEFSHCNLDESFDSTIFKIDMENIKLIIHNTYVDLICENTEE